MPLSFIHLEMVEMTYFMVYYHKMFLKCSWRTMLVSDIQQWFDVYIAYESQKYF